LKLTGAQYTVLFVMAHVHGLDQATLSRALGFDRVTTLRVVRGLETRGLIARTPSITDGRKSELSLTDEGREMCRLAQEPSEESRSKLMSTLTGEEQTTLINLLVKMCSALEPSARTRIVPPRA
jgi:DNA-binding MarR family transcriptional regulator